MATTNNPNDDEAPTGTANPSSSQADGLNAANDSFSSRDLEERQSLTLEQLFREPSTPPGQNNGRRREDPPTNHSLRSIPEKEKESYSFEDSAEEEEFDELSNIAWDETKTQASVLKRGPSESTLPANNLVPPQDSSALLLNLVLQSQRQIRELQDEIAQLKAQQPKKRASFDTQVSPTLLDGSIHPPQREHPHELHDSYLHGSDMNWSRKSDASDRFEASSRASEKRWKSFHVALNETEQAQRKDDTTGTNGSKIAEFSRRSSLVFMHPEEGKEKRSKENNEMNV
jgi:hypothetical protein